MQTYQINVSKGRDKVQEIRRELFAFTDILEVFTTSQPDALIVVCGGRPRAGEWLHALRALGYEASARRNASAVGPEVGGAGDELRVDETGAPVLSHEPTAPSPRMGRGDWPGRAAA